MTSKRSHGPSRAGRFRHPGRVARFVSIRGCTTTAEDSARPSHSAGGGESDGEQVLDILAAHPATRRFIATKLARRFVADDPPTALVDRAAATFQPTGGDIRAVVRTIVTLRSSSHRRPIAPRSRRHSTSWRVQSVRAGSTRTTRSPLSARRGRWGCRFITCQPPTGYTDRADAWVNTGALLNRMNFAVALTRGDVKGVIAPWTAGPPDTHRPGTRWYRTGRAGRGYRRVDTVARSRAPPIRRRESPCCSARPNSSESRGP